MTEQQREQRGISRRTIAKGAAWTVPALPIIAATPAYAKSGGGPTGDFCNACKQPGASCAEFGFIKGYNFTITYTNNTNQTVYIYPKLGESPGGALDPVFQVTQSSSQQNVTFDYGSARLYNNGVLGAPVGASVAISPNGGSVTLIIDAGINGASGNFSASGFLFMAWGHTAAVGADPDHPYTPAPPPPPAVGEGWIPATFAFASFPPCDNVTCLPEGGCTDTSV